MALTQQRLAYVGARNAGIDGVPTMLRKYERLGYRTAYSNARYEYLATEKIASPTPQMRSIADSDFTALRQYDRQHFPAPRPAFLKAWVEQADSQGYVWVEEGVIQGYGLIRRCRQGFKIGPLFANRPHIADALFQALSAYAQGEGLYLDIPENNPEAKALVQRYKMQQVFETSRMYLKGVPEVKQNNIYGITTFELG